MQSWTDRPSHRAWLGDQFARIIAFAGHSIRPGGGFEWLDAQGVPVPGTQPQLFLTARMTYVAALGVARGIPGSGALLDHGVDSLLGFHRDGERGGWLSDPLGDKNLRKMTYDHVHVGLAASAAVAVGHARGQELLDAAVEVIDRRLWQESERALTESFGPDWDDPEEYRGANSNMHGTEAFLAIGAATGDRRWYERARDVADRLINGFARGNGWMLPEHYTSDWRPVLDYNRAEPEHQFRPYGWTIGHALEWSRLLIELRAALGDEAPEWLLEAAVAMTDRSLDAWATDGHDGFVYTTDWDGTVVTDKRLHWVLCEGIATVALLAGGDLVAADKREYYATWYRRLWDHAALYFIDSSGMWANELTPDLAPSEAIWPGRPDVYHSAGALLTPLVPPTPLLAAALLDG